MDENWRTSTHSGGNGACVEVRATGDGNIEVRDSKDRTGPVLSFARAEWSAFIRAAKQDDYHVLDESIESDLPSIALGQRVGCDQPRLARA